jgi:probable HAF family extracellular repeat protein
MISLQIRSVKINLIAMAIAAVPTMIIAGPAQAEAQNGIFELGSLGGFTSAWSVSADGRVVVGSSFTSTSNELYHAFRWTDAGGMTDIGGTLSLALGVSADGRVVVGGYFRSGQYHAFRWTQAGGISDLGSLGGGDSWALGVSANGNVVVGQYSLNVADSHAFRWTQSGGMIALGSLGGTDSEARGVSADGSVVVGSSRTSTGQRHAFRWTQIGGMTDLSTLGGGESVALGISADGSIVVGVSDLYSSQAKAFRWTLADGMSYLGSLGVGGCSANGVSSDGRVVVGGCSMVGNSLLRAFRWSQTTGMQSVDDWLRASGVVVATDMTSEATATNSDGSVVVGNLENGQAFIARVSSDGSGLVTLAEVQNSLYAAAHGSTMATSFATTAINGAHGRPLSRLVDAGQRTFWLAGDWGRDDHGSRSGDLGLAEAGLGYNFGPLQVNVSLGQTWAQQRLTLDGRAKVDGTYLMAEALVPVTGKLWATLGAYGHWGDADLRRAYLSGGLPDYSTARPAVQTCGMRARLDWDNALHAGSADFSPYVDLTYSEARLDAYTETGGGFPARFDARRDRATDLRLGSNVTYPLMGNLRLLGTLEAVHRFERSGTRATGEVIGMFGFDLAGLRNKQDWLRLGGGIEGPFAGGKAMLSINATTQGEAPNVWLAANWQVAF